MHFKIIYCANFAINSSKKRFGEIYKCRWKGTLVAAKCIKSAKIRRKWLAKTKKENVEDDSSNLDEENFDPELSDTAKDIAISDFRQEITILNQLR